MRQMCLFIGLGFLLLNTACQSHHKEKEKEIKFLVTKPAKMDTSIIQDYVCQIRSIQHIELRALERGYLQDIFVDEGKPVKKGQLMFRIMPMLYKAELQKVLAEVNFAEIEYLNTKQLAERNIVSTNELALAKAKYDKAKAELALAQMHLTFTEIRAPFDGIMDRFYVRLGSLVDEGDLLTTLSDNSKMWVYFNVPEAEYLNYESAVNKEKMTTVNLLMANNTLFEHAGKVETIEADFNNENGNIAFRATFPNPKGLLRHGETGNIQMTVPLNNVVIIPQKATFEILEKKYVFVVGKDNAVEQREVTIGSEMPDLYIVSNGLTDNDMILLEGIRKVSNRQEIAYDYKEPMDVITHLNVYVE